MKQDEIIKVFESISICYKYLEDFPRQISFGTAARDLELGIELKGKNLQVYQELQQDQKSTRLEELKQRVPLELLEKIDLLYDINLEDIKSYFNQYQSKTLKDLYKIDDQKVKTALNKLDLNTNLVGTSYSNYKILGDLFTSPFPLGMQKIEQLVLDTKARNYKHVFIVNQYPDEKTFRSEKQKIIDHQQKHNTRIWQGQLVDIFRNDNIFAAEYYVLVSSKNLGKAKKLENAIQTIRKHSNLPIILDVLDYFVNDDFKLEELQKIIIDKDLILGLGPKDLIESKIITEFLKGIVVNNVALFSRSHKGSQLGLIRLASQVASELGIVEQQIINTRSHPFREDVKVRQKIEIPNIEEWLHRLEEK